MAKKYQIQIDLESSAAMKSVRDFRAELEKAERAGQKLGQRMATDFAAASPKVKKFTADVTATTQAYAGLGRQAVAALDAVTAGTKRAAKATKDKEHVDVGYFKFVADSLKKQTKDEQATRQKQIEWERKHVIDINKVKASGFKAASDQIEKHRKDYEDAKKKQIDWERKNVIDVTQMHASAMKSKSTAIEKQFKDEEALKKRWLDWEKKNVISIGQLEDSAVRLKSKSIDSQLTAQQKYQAGFTKALTDQEIAQDVANAKMARSNDARSKAAMKAAGIEVEANGNVAKSVASMIARYAAYHVLIGTVTQAWREYGESVKSARQQQDAMLNKFNDERSELRPTAATLGRVNDNQFYAEVKAFGTRTGMSFGQANDFIKTTAEGASQYISQPGETAKEQADRGRKLTYSQFQAATEKGARFGVAHGLTDTQTANMLAVAMGDKDVRGMGAKGVDEIVSRFARPTIALEHGRGSAPVLQGQAAEFHAAFGGQFPSMDEEAVFLSTIAQGTPAGRVYTQAQGLLSELSSPNKGLRKELQKVDFKGGKLLGRGEHGEFASGVTDHEKLQAIRLHIDKLGLKGVDRENYIRKHFTARTGLRAALQVFGEKAEATEAERRAYMDQNASPAALAADMAKREATEDIQLQKARAYTAEAEMKRVAPDSPLSAELEAAAKSRMEKGLTGGSGEAVGNVIDKITTVGRADNSETMKVRLETQRLLLKEIESSPHYDMRFRGRTPVDRLGRSVGPPAEPGKGYVPFGPMAPEERVRADLLRLKTERDRLRGLDSKAGIKRPGDQASRADGGVGSDAALVSAVSDLKTELAKNNAYWKKALDDAGRGKQVTFMSPGSLPLATMPTQLLS